MKSQLFDLGIDWCKISDFQLFMMMVQTLPLEKTKIVLGDLDLQKLKPVENLQNGQIVLKDPDSDVVIDELAHKLIVAYLCKLHNLTKKVEYAANKRTKQALIDEDREKIKLNKDKSYKSFLIPLISAVKVRQSYTKDYVKNMGLREFFDDLNRLQIIVNTDALLQGSYSGMVNTSQIKRSAFNWMRECDEQS